MRTKAQQVVLRLCCFSSPHYTRACARTHTRTRTRTPWQGPHKLSHGVLPLPVSWQGVDKARKTKSALGLERGGKGRPCALNRPCLVPTVWVLVRCQPF